MERTEDAVYDTFMSHVQSGTTYSVVCGYQRIDGIVGIDRALRHALLCNLQNGVIATVSCQFGAIATVETGRIVALPTMTRLVGDSLTIAMDDEDFELVGVWYGAIEGNQDCIIQWADHFGELERSF